MSLLSDLKCWEITQCGNEKCFARNEPETPCWKIAKRHESYQSYMNICRDCIVYILKQDVCVLSEKEYHVILRKKGLSVKQKSGDVLRKTRKPDNSFISNITTPGL